MKYKQMERPCTSKDQFNNQSLKVEVDNDDFQNFVNDDEIISIDDDDNDTIHSNHNNQILGIPKPMLIMEKNIYIITTKF